MCRPLNNGALACCVHCRQQDAEPDAIAETRPQLDEVGASLQFVCALLLQWVRSRRKDQSRTVPHAGVGASACLVTQQLRLFLGGALLQATKKEMTRALLTEVLLDVTKSMTRTIAVQVLAVVAGKICSRPKQRALVGGGGRREVGKDVGRVQ